MFLHICRLVRCGSGQYPRITEAGLQQGDHYKEEEDRANHRDGPRQVLHQKRTVENEEEATGAENKAQSQRQHAILSSYDDSSIAVKTVSSREDFPFPPRPPDFFFSDPGSGSGAASGAGVGRACGSICWYSQSFIVFTVNKLRLRLKQRGNDSDSIKAIYVL